MSQLCTKMGWNWDGRRKSTPQRTGRKLLGMRFRVGKQTSHLGSHQALQCPPRINRVGTDRVGAHQVAAKHRLGRPSFQEPTHHMTAALERCYAFSLATSAPSTPTTWTPALASSAVVCAQVAGSTARVASPMTYVVKPSLAASSAVDLTQ